MKDPRYLQRFLSRQRKEGGTALSSPARGWLGVLPESFSFEHPGWEHLQTRSTRLLEGNPPEDNSRKFGGDLVYCERLQRMRLGPAVPPPLKLELSR